jgi:LacI family transcriptional regulator
MELPRQITLRDVALEAGVSVMTVSRAMRNQSNVARATADKIREAAKRLGYRPNPLVSALMSYRRAANPIRGALSIGFVTNFPTENGWKKSRINLDFYEGAKANAERHGYKLELFWVREPQMSGRRLSQVLYSRNISGLLIAPLPVALGHMRLEWERFSAVALGYSLAAPLLHRAVNHQFRSMRLALRRLRKMGYRRIGLALRASFDERVDHHWAGAFLVEQRRSSPQDPVPLFVVQDPEFTREAFLKWRLANKPEVVVSQHEEVIEWLREAGIAVPEKVGFVHLDCPDKSGAVAGIYQNGPEVGTVAVDFLVSMVQRNERGIPPLPYSILVDGSWVDGETLACRTPGVTEPGARNSERGTSRG